MITKLCIAPILMSKRFFIHILLYLIPLCFLAFTAQAQLGNRPNTQGNSNLDQRDPFAEKDPSDTTKKKKESDWDEEPAIISYKYLNAEVTHYYDSSLLFFHRNEYRQPAWYTTLGNFGSPARETIFTLNNTPGLRLGYDNWNVYRYTIDSVHFINTTRPYTSFSFMLGPKQMQWVDMMHTQNITPKWNFAFRVANNTSEGYYKMQKANGLNAYLSSNYKSEDDRLETKFAFIYNNFKNDENGGMLSDSLLSNPNYSNRASIPVFIESGLNASTSPIHNRQSELRFFLQNNYAWGKKDSLYNEDSTNVQYHFTPRFSIKHVLEIQTTRHKYQDALPNTAYYDFYDSFAFVGNDTVRSFQTHTSIDNKFSLNTFLGKDSQLVHVEAGIGIRNDWFNTNYFDPEGERIKNNPSNPYLFGQLRKDALKDNQWSYLADLTFFFAGQAIGNMKLDGKLSKSFPKLGQFTLGATQTIVSPSYQQDIFKSSIFEINNDFGNTTNTQLYANLWIKALKMNLGLRNQLIGNYIYLDESLKFQQYSTVFSILQFTGRKLFTFGAFSLDNEVVWQQKAGNAPVNLPAFMLRHQLAYKAPMFKDRLDAYLGIEVRYHTPYKADGYSFVYNQYYYQDNITLDNVPALSAFFNFKVKRLRAFVIGDQLQQMLFPKNIINAPGYAAGNAHIRFGFNWIMMN